MAKAPRNPNDGLLVPSVGKGADTVVRRCWTLLVHNQPPPPPPPRAVHRPVKQTQGYSEGVHSSVFLMALGMELKILYVLCMCSQQATYPNVLAEIFF